MMTPQLRFPEFTDEWELVALTDMISTVVDNRGKTPPVTTEGIPLIETNALGSKDVHYEVIKKFVTKTTYDTWFRKYLEKGDVLFSTVGQTGVTSLYDGSTVAGVAQNIVGLRSNDLASGDFLYYLLTEPRNNNKFKQIEMIAVQPSVKVSQMIHLKFNTPSKPEQEKIADFLTGVDERIAVGEKKLELLETYKRGVMQQIFSQKIRFKDENGNEYPEWQEKRLGEVGKIITGKTPSTTDKSHWTGEVKFVTPTDMDGQKYQETSTRTVSYTGSLMLPEKSIMYTCIASIGKMSMSVGDTITNQQINSFIPSSKICNEFTYYNLLWLTPRIISTQSNNTLPIINKSEFSKFKVFLPSWEEQQKIATFLTALDDKITAEKSKLTAAKQFKKALLQRMFV